MTIVDLNGGKMEKENVIIAIGILIIVILVMLLMINGQTGTEANNYYYHINDTVSNCIIPYIIKWGDTKWDT